MGKTLRWLGMLAFVLSLSCLVFPAYGQDGEDVEEVVSEEPAEPVEEGEGVEAGGDEMLVEEGEPTAEEIAAEIETEKAIEAQVSAEAAAREAESALGNGDYELAVAKLKEAVELVPDDEEKYLERLKDVQKICVYNLLREKKYAEAITQADDFLARFTDPDDQQVREVRSFRETAEELLEAQPVEETLEGAEEIPVMEQRTDDELVAEAIKAYRKGDYDFAKDLLLDAREINRFNVEVDRWLEKVNYKIYLHERSIRITTRREMVTEVERAWSDRPKRPEVEAGPITPPDEPEMTEARQRIMDKLNKIIPEVDFKEAELREVIDFLAREADVNIVIDPIVFQTLGPAETAPPLEGPGFAPEEGTGFMEEETFEIPEEEPGELEFAPQGSMRPPGGDILPPPGMGPDFPGPPGTGFDDLGTAPPVGGYTMPQSTKITIQLKNVPLRYVLRYVLRYKSLKYVVEDYAILIIPIDYVLPEDLETEIFRLSTSGVGATSGGFATAGFGGGDEFGGGGGGGGFGDEFGGGGFEEEMGTGQPENIEDWLRKAGGVTWPRGSDTVYHQPTATLIVTNTPTNMVLIRELIKIWDRPPMQVEVEARFVELQQNRNFENSFRIAMTDALRWTRNEESNFGTRPLMGRERLEVAMLPSGNNLLRFYEPTTSAFLDIKGILTRPEFQITWYALDKTDYTDLLSAPRVTTVSGQQALIQVVQEIRYPTEYETESLEEVVFVESDFQAFYVTPGTFEEREVGVRLNVTPTVSADDLITLVLLPEVSELVDWINYGTELIPAWQPVFESRNVTTTVYLNDGETLVLGGVITDNITNISDRVPFFGSIPGLGRFFRSEYEVISKANLVIFVTADLITSRGTRVRQEAERRQQQERFLEQYRRQLEEAEEEGMALPAGP